MIFNQEETIRSHLRLQEEREELEAHMLSFQKTVSQIQAQMQKERDLRLKAESELKEMRLRNQELEDRVLNSKVIAAQMEAHLVEGHNVKIKDTQELLYDVSQAYLMQYEYLRHRKAFTSVVRLPWLKLKHRIASQECLKEMLAVHERKIAKEPFDELKDAGVQVNKRHFSGMPELIEHVGTSTDDLPREMPTLSKPVTVDVGVNTKAAHRVTRATQATETKPRPTDRSTQCVLLESSSAVVVAEEEESSLDFEDIFKSTIFALPEMVDEIGDLEVPKVSSACQTELANHSQETLTEINDLSRVIEFKPVAKRLRGNAVAEPEGDPVKSELSSDLLGSNCGSLEDFEHYWSMAGRSLMGALLEVKPRNDITSELECFQRQVMQQQMVDKFLRGAGVVMPVKKAVSIPSVYAESTKSGYERDVEGSELGLNDGEEDGSNGRLSVCGIEKVNSISIHYFLTVLKRPLKTSRSSSVESTSRILNKKSRRSSHRESSMESDCMPTPAVRETSSDYSEERMSECAREEMPLPSPTIDVVPEQHQSIAEECPKTKRKTRLVTNRTVDRILQARANVFRMRQPAGVMTRRSVSYSKAPATRQVQLKRIRLIKQEKKEEVVQGERTRFDSGSEVDEGKLDSIRDFFTLPEFLDPILDGEIRINAEVEEGEIESKCSSIHTSQATVDAVDEETTIDLDYSPSSPPPSDRTADPDHVPKQIETQTQISLNRSANQMNPNNCMRRLKLTHTTINQFIQNYPGIRRLRALPKKFDLLVTGIVKDYLDSEWTAEAAAECVGRLGQVLEQHPLDHSRGIVDVILNLMECCEDDIPFEPFNSLAPFMPKTHQKAVLVVDRLGLGSLMIQDIERRIFTMKAEGVKLCGVINWTYLYLSLQDLEINKHRGCARPLRLFLVKALYYLKMRSIIVVFMTLKAFPKLLPRIERGKPFVVGGHGADPLVDVIVCVLMNHRSVQQAHHLRKSEEVNLITRYSKDWTMLQKFYYGYTPFQPRPDEVLSMLLERMRCPGKELNLVHAILVLAKHMDMDWTKNELLAKGLMPMAEELMLSASGTAEAEDQLCLCMTVIAGLVKVFPKDEDVSMYRNVFRNVLVDTERFPSYRVQECAVMSIVRLAGFGAEYAFNAIRDWYTPPEQLTLQLRAVLQTYISRQTPLFWVNLSNAAK